MTSETSLLFYISTATDIFLKSHVRFLCLLSPAVTIVLFWVEG